jgi:hypothetical protein
MNLTNFRTFAVCAALSAPLLASAPVFAQKALPPPQALPVAQAPPVAPAPPAAQAPPGDPATILVRSRELFTRGNKLYDQGNLQGAEAAYLDAWKLKKSYDVGGNLGNVEADLKKWRAAAEYLSYALREFPAGGRTSLRDDMIGRLTEAQKYVGKLLFQVNHAGAEVFIDGASVGIAPLQQEVYVDPGTHLVEARLEGYPPAQATVTAARGRADTVPLTLVAAVTGPNRKVVIAGAVVTGVLAIAGGAMLGLYASKGSSASSLYTTIRGPQNNGVCPPPTAVLTGNCAALLSDLNAKATFGTTGAILLPVAGAVGLATLIYGLAGGSRGPRSGLVVAPVLTAESRGVFVQGSF